MKIIPYILLLFTLTLFSCEKEIIFDGELPGPRLVVFSFIEPDSVIKVEISTSRAIGESSDLIARNVAGELYINHELKGTLRELSYNQFTTDACAKEGDHIRLVVRADGMKEVSAEADIPSSKSKIKLDTLSSPNSSSNHTNLNMQLRISETEALPHYYRVIVLEHYRADEKNLTLNKSLPPTFSEYYGFNKKNEPLLNERNNSSLWEDEDEDKNFYNIFSNSLFKGKSYTLNISTDFASSYNQTIHYTRHKEISLKQVRYQYTVKLLQLDEPIYLYLRSEETSYTEGWMDPIKVYSNVKNGLGVVGAFLTTQFILDPPLVEYEPLDSDYNPFYYDQ